MLCVVCVCVCVCVYVCTQNVIDMCTRQKQRILQEKKKKYVSDKTSEFIVCHVEIR